MEFYNRVSMLIVFGFGFFTGVLFLSFYVEKLKKRIKELENNQCNCKR